jgi:DNA-binding response OmpR family regulator
MKPYQVMLLDDDIDILECMKFGLGEEFKVSTFSDSTEALSFLEKNSMDAIVLDYHMPGIIALNLYQQLRQKKPNQPIMFLTGETSPQIRVQGLEVGADDFLHKPISMPELGAHIKNRIRYYAKKEDESVEINNLKINYSHPDVLVDDEIISLTRKEFQILCMLARKVNSVVPREEFIGAMWQNVKVEENNLDTHLSNLRKKLKNFSGEIKTIKCFGYILKSV